jgi:glycopeptide antibiotics resistance protein
MTTTQLTGIQFGLIGFLVIWPVIALAQYFARRNDFGRRILASGVVTLYACVAIAVVLLPLPGPNTRRPAQTIQLLPFQWVLDGTRGDLLAFQQVAMNVVLFVPLGVFVAVLWRRSFRHTVLIGFAASMLIEITQLTGNFGTAPFVYRIFDVDDLVTNTLGAALGWIAVSLVTHVRVVEPMRGQSPARDRVLVG